MRRLFNHLYGNARPAESSSSNNKLFYELVGKHNHLAKNNNSQYNDR